MVRTSSSHLRSKIEPLRANNESPRGNTLTNSIAISGGHIQTKNPFLFPLDLLAPATIAEAGTVVSDDKVESQNLVTARGQWWLVHAKPRQEKKLAEELRILGVPHYLPATHCKSITRGSSRYSWSPLFSGYLFINATSEQRLVALKTNRIVATQMVANQEVLEQQLWDLADLIEKGVPLRIEERLVAGQEVQVKAGMLKGKRGIVIKRSGKMRLCIMIPELLGGVSLEIEQHYVELT